MAVCLLAACALLRPVAGMGCSAEEWFAAARVGDDSTLLACLARNYDANTVDELGSVSCRYSRPTISLRS